MSRIHDIECPYCEDHYSQLDFDECPNCKDQEDHCRIIQELRNEANLRRDIEENKIAAEIKEAITNLEKNFDKYALVWVLQWVGDSRISARAAADIILKSASYDRLRTSN